MPAGNAIGRRAAQRRVRGMRTKLLAALSLPLSLSMWRESRPKISFQGDPMVKK